MREEHGAVRLSVHGHGKVDWDLHYVHIHCIMAFIERFGNLNDQAQEITEFGGWINSSSLV